MKLAMFGVAAALAAALAWATKRWQAEPSSEPADASELEGVPLPPPRAFPTVKTPQTQAAPACLQALADATSKWPSRKKASDGIMGDASHQARKSDHNQGLAFDITHDPASGCTGDKIAAAALRDPRTKYVIWDRRIINRQQGETQWRAYTGANPHTHHCHVSIKPEAADDRTAWPF